MSNNPDQNKLAEQISQGNALAEKQLFEYFGSRIKLLVRARLRGWVTLEEQQDIVSEINQALLTSLRKGGFNPAYGKPLEAYIAGIAGNYVALYYRGLKKKIPLSDIIMEKIESPENIVTSLLKKERAERLRSCISRLKSKYLEVLIMRFYEDKSIEEIAAELDIERKRVSERINYAVKLLLKECESDGYFQ